MGSLAVPPRLEVLLGNAGSPSDEDGMVPVDVRGLPSPH